jgi:hypothetical protein
VFDLKNKSVMLARDVRWLGKTYSDYFNINPPKTTQDTDLESSDNEIWVKPPIEVKRPAEEAKKRETQPFSIVTRSRAIMDAVEDDESEEESEDLETVLLVNEVAMGDPYSFNKAFFMLTPREEAIGEMP